jgi:hypothetical protein
MDIIKEYNNGRRDFSADNLCDHRFLLDSPKYSTERQLYSFVTDCIKAALTEYTAATGAKQPYMSKRKAFATYGQGVVERWVREGLVAVNKDSVGNFKARLSVAELSKAAAASNYASFFNHSYKKRLTLMEPLTHPTAPARLRL